MEPTRKDPAGLGGLTDWGRVGDQLEQRAGAVLPWTALLGLAAFSVSSCGVLALGGASLRDFIARNDLPTGLRQLLLACLVLTAGPLALFAVVELLLEKPPIALEALRRWGRLSAPLVVTCPALILSVYRYWIDHPLEFLLLLALTSFVFERLLRLCLAELTPLLAPLQPSLARVRAARWVEALPLALVLAAAAGYALFLGYFTIQQHHRIQTGGFDLGHYEILMYNFLHGHPYRSTILWGSGGGNNLANHAELGMLLLLPFYALHPSGEAMLVIQAVLMGGSVIPLFLLCRSALGPLTALGLCFAYLIAASFSSPLFYDFHWLPLAIPFHFLLMYALNTRRHRLALVSFVLALLIREDVALTLALGSTYFITTRRNVKLGVALFTASLTWFVVVKFGVMRLAGTFDFGGMLYAELIISGEQGFGSVAKTALTNPLYFLSTLLTLPKLIFMLHLLVPLAFLPWRNWRWALMSCGGFAVTLMTTRANDALISIRFHYLMHWTPYLYAATVVALHALGSTGVEGVVRRRAALGALLFASTLHSLTFGPIFQRSNFIGGFQRIPFAFSEADRVRAEAMRQAKLLIPESASVAATDLEVAQLTTRLTAYSTKVDIGSADFILLDRTHVDAATVDKLNRTFTTEPYGLLFQQGQLLLFKRGHRDPRTAAAVRGLGITYAEVPIP